MSKLSKKIQSLPPYLFAEIDKAKRKARARGRDIIDLGVFKKSLISECKKALVDSRG